MGFASMHMYSDYTIIYLVSNVGNCSVTMHERESKSHAALTLNKKKRYRVHRDFSKKHPKSPTYLHECRIKNSRPIGQDELSLLENHVLVREEFNTPHFPVTLPFSVSVICKRCPAAEIRSQLGSPRTV